MGALGGEDDGAEADSVLGRAEGAKVVKLSRGEAKGLYVDTSRMGTRDGWEAALAAKGLQLRGHRLVRRSLGAGAPSSGDT